MVSWVTSMFGYFTANASSAALRAVPSAGDDSQAPSVTSPLTVLGSKAAVVPAGPVAAGPLAPGPPVPGAGEPVPPPHAARTNAAAKPRVSSRWRIGNPPEMKV